MKTKGFTLIELLAVILILGIIFLIAIPLVTKVVDEAREKSFKTSVLNIFDATDKYLIINHFMELPTEGIEISNLKNLNHNNFISGNILLNNQKEYEINNVSDGRYCANGTIDNITINKGICDFNAPTISITQSGSIFNFTIIDNSSLKGYAITKTTDVPTTWTAITGKVYNGTYTATEEGTIYLHMIDIANNKTYKEIRVELVKVIEINTSNFSSAVSYNSSAASNSTSVTINDSTKEARLYTYKRSGNYTTAASAIQTKEPINFSDYNRVEIEFTASSFATNGSYCIIGANSLSTNVTNKELEDYGTILSYIDNIKTTKFTYDISKEEGLRYFKIRNLITNDGTNSGTQTFTLKSLKFYK